MSKLRPTATPKVSRKRTVILCRGAEKIISDVPPYIGLTGDALRWCVERCVAAQRKADMKDKANGK